MVLWTAAPVLPVTIRPLFAFCPNAVMARSTSPASRTSTGRNSTLSDGATAWIAANWPGPDATAGSRRTIALVKPGAIALSNSSHFPLIEYS